MSLLTQENLTPPSLRHLQPDCSNCFGLCCLTLYFSKQDGFPADKSAGMPCSHLREDFRCAIHDKLTAKGCKGCVAYECFGAGQQVSQVTYKGRSWREDAIPDDELCDVYLVMYQLQEICWYLTLALSYKAAAPMKERLTQALHATEQATILSPQALLAFDLSAHRAKVGTLLKEASGLVRGELSLSRKIQIDTKSNNRERRDYLGKDLRKKDLRYAELRGACLIAANLENMDLCGADFLGADLRDANLRGADLLDSIFLNQSQINAAQGNSDTKLPLLLTRPRHWG